MQRGEAYNGTLSTAKWKYDPMTSSLLGLNLSKEWNTRQTTTLGYSFARADFDFMQSDFKNEAKVTSTGSGYGTWAQAVDLRHVIAFTNNTVRVGGQFLSQATNQDMVSLYAYDEHRFFGDKLTLDGSIRVDKKYYHRSPVTGNDMNEWSKEVYSLATGVAYKINRIFTATGRFAYSENTLASYQVDADKKDWLPPERRLRYEGGLLANIHPAFNPWVTLFYYDTKNQQVSTTVGGMSYYIDPDTGEEIDYVTTSDVRTRGAEIGVSGGFLKYFTYNLNYSYMETDNYSTNKGQPHVTASGRVGYKYKNFDINLNTRYYGKWAQSTSDGQAAAYDYGDFFNTGANVSYKFNLFKRDTKVTAYIQNIGDKHFTTRYRANVGAFKDPGRRIGVELSYSFF
jgi:iron complex outermembrane receptor protein